MSPLEYFIPDYLSSEHFLFVESSLKEHTEPVLQYFITNTPENALYSQAEKTCNAMVALQLPTHIKQHLPTIIGDYLSFLATRGVFPQASTWQLKFEALQKSWTQSFNEKTLLKGETIKNKGMSIGRNDPCFCGSGKKFKKCCMTLL